MYCKNCGNNVDDSLTFCDVCGAELSSDASLNLELSDSDILPEVAHDDGKILGIVSLVLGIAGLICGLFSCCCCTCCCLTYVGTVWGLIISSAVCILGLILSITGLILGIIAIKKSKKCGFKNMIATIGLILSVIAMVITLFIVLLAVVYVIIAILMAIGTVGIGTLDTIFSQQYY